jgi:pimeloyl-ACP methyl ester carboxylesterase
MPFVVAAGRKLEYEWIEGEHDRPPLVFLHEGLTSLRQWRDFPALVAAETGCAALVYSRYGYGGSDVLEEPRVGVRYMHDEALVSLPKVLANLGIDRPILIGHSDGASIALIHAGSGHPVSAIVALAPHVFVEEESLRSIERLRGEFETTDLRERMAKYHRDPRKTFFLWNDVWLDPEFRRWNIEEYLPDIRCPLLLIQGADDQYGTMEQLRAIERQTGGVCRVVKLAQCGHSPHRDQPEATLAAIAEFVRIIGS